MKNAFNISVLIPAVVILLSTYGGIGHENAMGHHAIKVENNFSVI